jgi:RHH-type proline utilization regulon transcriptional repressor/proline dehydrogenase/delta 1-pyrroline-5-carboxylate dehydrogenase
VIERAAQERVLGCIALAADQGRIAGQRLPVPDVGWYCPPTVATDLPADSRLLREEIFGPVLTVEAVASVQDACDVVNGLPVALTGGLYARDPATVRHVCDRSPVGNLYVNRAITGAKVGRHPFGGNRLSGSGTKAGGPGYLRHFVEPRVVSENTLRHGLVV